MTNEKSPDDISKNTIDRIIELYLSLLLISDCRKLIKEGKFFHLTSIYGQLRAILTDSTQKKNNGPILLSLSKFLNIDLSFFYNPLLEEYSKQFDVKDTVLLVYELELSLQKLNNRHRMVSIEEFLDKDILVYKGLKYKMKEIINKLSNKLGGSHYDATIPKDIAGLSNINWGDIPILDNYLLKFVDILLPVALRIPKQIADCEIWFGFTLYTFPIIEFVLFDISIPNRHFNISLICFKNKISLKIRDLIGSIDTINIDSNFELNKMTILSISHVINNRFESEFSIYKNGVLITTHHLNPLILYNQYYWSELYINKSMKGDVQNFRFGVHQARLINWVFTEEQRQDYLQAIYENNTNPLNVPANKYAIVERDSEKMKIVN